tara:strand:- start:941 stop:1135 length:195 start_codon:yes stop_codon:yes gene_type:complete
MNKSKKIAGKGGSPYQPYDPPEGPKKGEPYVPAPGKSPQKLAKATKKQIKKEVKRAVNDPNTFV